MNRRLASPFFTGLVRLAMAAAVIASAQAAAQGAEPARAAASAAAAVDDDPYLWLEDLDGERAMAWVRARNAESSAAIESLPGYAALREQMRAVYDAADRIPAVQRHGRWLYNLWQDAGHPRGVWRRTTASGYARAEVPWQTVLDLDALARAEGVAWTWKRATCLPPAYARCLLSLSRGGADATRVREFDTVAMRFVDDGYALPEAKSVVEWIDLDTIWVATDVGPGSLTRSGYPRVLKRWSRGTPLAEAPTVHEIAADDVGIGVEVDRTPGHARTWVLRYVSTRRVERLLLEADGRARPIPLPPHVKLEVVRGTWLVEPREPLELDGTTHAPGTLLAIDAASFLAGRGARAQVLFDPTPTRSLRSVHAVRDYVLLHVLDNVSSRLEEWQTSGSGRWRRQRAVPTPTPGTLAVVPLYDPVLDGVPAEGERPSIRAGSDEALANAYLLRHTSFTSPDTLWLGRGGSDARRLLKQRRPLFDAAGMRVEQRHATSRDGTRVPYFVVWPRDAGPKAPRPTLLYGYGGFEVALLPFYPASQGVGWLARGGVFVLANIRGGGEFGPAWHRAAVGARKQASYDDFIAVAEDLVAAGVTAPRQLAIQGASNGGLLVGAVMLQRPELFGAVLCDVPLLDMKRYGKLHAGASWVGEYGDPDDPAQWAWIAPWSPYQNVRAGTKLPPVLLTSSTRDDRVHPGHARKMTARLRELGHEALYVENVEGGHAAAADNEQRARMTAMRMAWAWGKIGSAN